MFFSFYISIQFLKCRINKVSVKRCFFIYYITIQIYAWRQDNSNVNRGSLFLSSIIAQEDAEGNKKIIKDKRKKNGI